MLLNGGELEGKRILKTSSIEAMTKDRFRPEEHKNGGFFDRYPGRGFGYTVAIRTEPLAVGPSVGAYNWAGSSGVWFVVDPPRNMLSILMAQHSTKGANPKTHIPYVSRVEENDLYQAAVYADVLAR
jgi:CubicO group peptidase (beta-lactamase class C family)